MHISKKPLHRKTTRRIPHHILALSTIIAVAVPYQALTTPAVRTEPYEQDFIITAYYSPLAGQCCYVKGGFVADKVLNGEGVKGADGTPVVAGMIAAPASYAFGTAVRLPGLGTFTVHDRGGAINDLPGGASRLDIWVGSGEEGLARALAFGVRRIKGTVYPLASKPPAASFDLATLPSPIGQLQAFFIERDNLMAMKPKVGQHGLSVFILQDHLQNLGYLHKAPTGFFGKETESALAEFLRDFHVSATADSLTDVSAAYLLGATQRLGAREPVSAYVEDGAKPEVIADAERTLRFLGYYKGRTDGVYGDLLQEAILKFQQDHMLVGTAEDPGAGRIGPVTRTALRDAWNAVIVAKRAHVAMDIHRIDRILSDNGKVVQQFLEEGYAGAQVRVLQNLLADRGLFPASAINGSFGPLTKEAVASYQLSRRIIEHADDEFAGTVGPLTLVTLRREERSRALHIVRANGWNAL